MVATSTEMPPVKSVTSDKQNDNAILKAPLSAISPNKTRANMSSKVPQPVKTATKPVSSPNGRPSVRSEADSIKTYDSSRKIPVSASPARKPRKDIKIFKDPAPPQTGTTNVTARGLNSNQSAGVISERNTAASTKPGLRPLLLRADSAQGFHAPAKSFTDGNPMMSTPTKRFGQAANAWAVSNNASATSSRTLDGNTSIRSSVTPKKTTINRSSVAQIRDSKELRSPESIKTQKGIESVREQNKENITVPSRPSIAAGPKEPTKNVGGFFKSKPKLDACECPCS